MKASKNPFFFRELSEKDPFCDREKELEDLVSYAEGNANVVLYSPRRYGKTSLVRRVQALLSQRQEIVIFADLFGASSVDDVAARLAKAVFDRVHLKDRLFKIAIQAIKSFRPVLKPDESGGVSLSVETSPAGKGGIDLLEETMLSLGEFIKKTDHLVNIALDEFQEIVELKEASQIEGVMRSQIQRYKASCFFIGSRRRLLLAMFNDRQRPFFQSAINYELKKLPFDDLSKFIVEMFHAAGRSCSFDIARAIAGEVSCHPYYCQKLAFFIYEISGKTVKHEDVKSAFVTMLDSERPLFEAQIQGLAPQQIALISALSAEPSKSVFSIDYMKRYSLGSTGGVQGALKKLTALDMVEKDDDGRWSLVDPVFQRWLVLHR